MLLTILFNGNNNNNNKLNYIPASSLHLLQPNNQVDSKAID